MKKIKNFLIIFILLIVYTYVCNITLLPDNIIIFEGESLNFKTIAGINIKRANRGNSRIIQTSNNENLDLETTYTTAGLFELDLNLFGTIPVKEINVNVIPRTTVIPMGDLIGIKLYTSGVLVVGMAEIEGSDAQIYKPYENSGIQEGDMIIEMNNQKINNTEKLLEVVSSSQGKQIEVKYVRDNQTLTTNIVPIMNDSNEYKLGLWVRDAAAGVGTLSFYEPTTGNFAALGHGITDVDTGGILNIAKGELVNSKLVSIKKGEKNEPGELQGSIDGQSTIGEISKNTNFGVFGNIANSSNLNLTGSTEYEVALRSEIKTGEAQLICDLGNGSKETYKIKIEKIYTSNNYDNKSMLIKITDDRLLAKTGGIVQGMSGSPIIQNGKFVGAVTNVLVSDPTTGYAIFADLMIKQMRSTQ